MRNAVLLSALLAHLAACGKKEEPVAPATGSGSGSAASLPTASTPPAAAAAADVACLNILSKELRAKYFDAATYTSFTSSAGTDGVGEKCNIKKRADSKFGMTLEWACGDTVQSVKHATIKEIKESYPETQDLSGVGDAALLEVLADGQRLFNVWVGNCTGNGTLASAIDAPTFIKDWLAQLPRT